MKNQPQNHRRKGLSVSLRITITKPNQTQNTDTRPRITRARRLSISISPLTYIPTNPNPEKRRQSGVFRTLAFSPSTREAQQEKLAALFYLSRTYWVCPGLQSPSRSGSRSLTQIFRYLTGFSDLTSTLPKVGGG